MNPVFLVSILSALAMSVGWGYRGDYGHEHGAMIPGALLALAIVLTARRPDWLARASLLGMMGAIGWAFGGQMSYGLLIGYTSGGSSADVAFGFACIFLVGALWGGIGSGILALGVTEPRSRLERFAAPLILLYLTLWSLHLSGLSGLLQERWSLIDSDWLAATVAILVAGVSALLFPRSRPACLLIALLGLGWWLGFGILVVLAGLRVNPPRSENWAGCVGIMLALIVFHAWKRNRVVLWLIAAGLIAGGLGFALGDGLNMLGRAKWGPIGASETLRAMNSWKWMEQSFGLIMGFGVGYAFARVARAPLKPVADDEPSGPLRLLAPIFLMVPMLWESLRKNVSAWSERGHLRDGLFGLSPETCVFLTALVVSAVITLGIVRARRGLFPMAPASPFGRAQFLFLYLLWVPALSTLIQVPTLETRGALFVHVSFWLTAAFATTIVLFLSTNSNLNTKECLSPNSPRWRPLPLYLALLILTPVTISALTFSILSTHEGPLKNARTRFGDQAPANPAP